MWHAMKAACQQLLNIVCGPVAHVACNEGSLSTTAKHCVWTSGSCGMQ